MMMHKALHLRDDIDALSVSRKVEGNDSPALKTALIHQYKDLKNT